MRNDGLQTNFTAGEISPSMLGRSDISRYQNGAKKVRNMIVRPQGGIERRPGTKFIATTKHSTERVFLYKFEFSVTQVYLLEFGRLYLRIYQNDELLPIEIVTPYTEADWDRLTFSQSADILFIAHPNHQTRRLSRYSTTNWVLDAYEATDGPYASAAPTTTTLTLSGITATATISLNVAPATPVAANDYIEFREEGKWRLGKVTAVNSTTSFSVTYFTNIVSEINHDEMAAAVSAVSGSPSKVSPYVSVTATAATPPNYTLASDHNDVFSTYDVGKYIRVDRKWYLITSFDGISGGKQNVSGNRDLVLNSHTTASTFAALDTNGCVGTLVSKTITGTITASDDTFVSTDVGRHIRLNYGGAWMWCIITAYTSATSVTVSIESDIIYDPNQIDSRASSPTLFDPQQLYNNGVTNIFKLGAWSDTTGWPSHVTFHQDRLCFARTDTEPQSFWLSASGDYYNHAVSQLDSTVLDTDAIAGTLLSTESNEITWLSAGAVLLMGTVSGEWQIRPASSINEALTPTNVRAITQSPNGSRPGCGVARIDTTTIFVQRHGFKVYEMAYNFQVDGYETNDLTIISEHILKEGGGAYRVALQKEPFQLVWVLTNAGTLACMTYEKKQEVVGWSLHDVGGVVESIVMLPDEDAEQDSIYLAVNRTIGGQQVRYIEKLDRHYDPLLNSRDDAIYTDSTVTYSGVATTTITGLGHLEGVAVDVVADGTYAGQFTVQSGSVTISVAAQKAHVGIPFTAYVTTLPVEGGGSAGSSSGKIRRIPSSNVLLKDAAGVCYGESPDNAPWELTSLTSEVVYGQPPALESGWVNLQWNLASSRDGTATICMAKPYPATILSIATSNAVGNLPI